ncbi:hypothetical protein ECOK1357_5264 [Escherichia coli OK1357]|uniref:Uncharacterized protein n=1 Tax=Shigella flexneri CDC 796-83 TaxID=945360 RepID=A0A6N3QK33_SHIFL|nr:hypothetical protein SGF_02785 [Shigella flexneri CDC 796-83]EFZ66826.1 hypothetical protein ECOK1357_5264 [Escherichia coli OK1357]EGK17249.1 hypothetical protein SFK218_4810 [Shigella flexneri K-218]EIQ07745.1 hypothetical protein SFK1770_4084 [Shigella flexneri K-1770]
MINLDLSKFCLSASIEGKYMNWSRYFFSIIQDICIQRTANSRSVLSVFHQ